MRIARIRKGKPYLLTDVGSWGGKGDNLLKLSEVFNVPQGFVISSDTFAETIKQNDLTNFLNQVLRKDNPIKAYEEIRGRFQEIEFPRETISRLEQEFNSIKGPVAVRSSSVNEDGNQNSYAGQHETILGVTDFPEFLLAMKEVYASLHTPRAIEYRRSKELPNDDSLAIVVQTMVNPLVSGVAYSPSPNNPKEILIESTWGLCTSIVDGRPCDIYRVLNTVTGEMTQDISKKKVEMDLFDPRSRRVITTKTPLSKIRTQSLTNQQALEVAKTVKQIENAYGVPMDMEFLIDADSGLLNILQARPITGLKVREENITLPNIPTNRILARSKNLRNQGIFEGPAVVVRLVDHANRSFVVDGNLTDLNKKYSKGYVLITPEVPPQLEQFVTNARAMYATECGTTGHAAAVASEKGIIYLGRGNNSVPDLLTTVRSGTKVGIAVSNEEGILYLA